MEQMELLAQSPLFEGLDRREIAAALDSFAARRMHFERGQLIRRSGEPAREMGLVLSGMVHMIKEDYWGGSSLLGRAGPGELFAEAYACGRAGVMGCSVFAAEPAEILFLNVRNMMEEGDTPCGLHSRIMRNLAAVMAEKNCGLARKISHISKRSLREKILSYLSAEAEEQGSAEIIVPYNRQQMADYLSADRSALSAELGRMQREGILTYKKNRFSLLRHGQ